MKKSQTQRRIFCLFGIMTLLISLDLVLSVLGDRYTSDPIYHMVGDFYEIDSLICAFESCERNVTAYRWSEKEDIEKDWKRTIEMELDEMNEYLEKMVIQPDVNHLGKYYDIRALKHLFPHYKRYISSFLQEMTNGNRKEALEAFYQRERSVVLIQNYFSQLLRDTMQSSQAEYENAKKIAEFFWHIQILVGLCAISLSAFFAYKLYEIINPIRQLIEASEELEKEHFYIQDISVKSKNPELKQLIETFNSMKRSTSCLINTLNEHNRTQELLRQAEAKRLESQRLAEQAKLLSLRTQINPHFLFNTLNTIRRVAQIENAAQTEELILALSGVFRYSMRNDDIFSTLEEEIFITKQYYKIQKVRFGERINIEWNFSLDCDLDEILVPPFMIETLVENSVKHGLEPKIEGGSIKVEITRQGEFLVIIVSDDGCGMNREKLELLSAGNRPVDATSGIGLNNIFSRLKLLGENNEMKIESEIAKGTRVTIKMPIHYREEEMIR